MEYCPGLDMVVVNYQTPGELWAFLNSYYRAKIEIPHSLLVVNVQPQDPDLRIVQEWSQLIPFMYYEYKENVGYAGACNRAVRLPDREAVAFFNADVQIEPGSVEKCYQALMGRPDWGVLGPRQVDRRGCLVSAGVFGTSSAPTLRGWMRRDDGSEFADVREDAVSVSGSAYFVKRAVWDELASCELFFGCPEVWAKKPCGAFLPTPHYFEETYLSYHAREHGYRVVYYGPACMTHGWSQKRAESARNVHWKESKQLFRTACDFHDMEHN